MPIDPQKFFFPLTIVASVAGVWLLLRGSNSGQVTVPNSASSGVPATYTESGVVQPVVYEVPESPTPTGVSPATVLSDPYATNPGGTPNNGTPAYLSYAQPPQNNVVKGALLSQQSTPSSSPTGCSCKKSSCSSGCGNAGKSASYVDGNQTTPLASSRGAQLVLSGHNWLESAAQNINGYNASLSSPAVPTLTSTPASASLD